MGSDILDYLKNKAKDTGQSVVVVDFNPQIVESLVAGNFNVVFGDISDPEILEQLNLARAKLIITTVPDLVDNTNLIKFAKEAIQGRLSARHTGFMTRLNCMKRELIW